MKELSCLNLHWNILTTMATTASVSNILSQSTFTYFKVSTVKYVNYIIQRCTFFHLWLWPRLAADWEDDKNVISHQINRRTASRPQSDFNSDVQLNVSIRCICQSLAGETWDWAHWTWELANVYELLHFFLLFSPIHQYFPLFLKHFPLREPAL